MTAADVVYALVYYLPESTTLGALREYLDGLESLVLIAAKAPPAPQVTPEAVTCTKVTHAPEAQPKKPAESGGDTLAPEEFFETECYHGGWVTAKDLYGAYVAFAAAQDLEPLSGVKFGRAARERFTYRKTAAGGKYETSVEGVDHNA